MIWIFIMRLLKLIKNWARGGGAVVEEDFWIAVALQKGIANSEAPVGTGTVAAKHKKNQKCRWSIFRSLSRLAPLHPV